MDSEIGTMRLMKHIEGADAQLAADRSSANFDDGPVVHGTALRAWHRFSGSVTADVDPFSAEGFLELGMVRAVVGKLSDWRRCVPRPSANEQSRAQNNETECGCFAAARLIRFQ